MTASGPLISVIMPFYNRATQITSAVRSVQLQTYQNFEVILVDDGSTDNTAEIVKKIADQDARIKLIKHLKNRGAQAARNTGILAAKGAWIAFLDSDDEWLPCSLELRIKTAMRENLTAVHGTGYIDRGDGIREPYSGLRPICGHLYAQLLRSEGVIFQSLLVSKAAIEKIGYLDERIVAFQEWDTAIRLARYFKFGFVEQPTFIWNSGTENSISKRRAGQVKGYKQIVHKNLVPIFMHCSPSVLGHHCSNISQLYNKAGRRGSAFCYSLLAKILNYLDPEWIIVIAYKPIKRISMNILKQINKDLNMRTIRRFYLNKKYRFIIPDYDGMMNEAKCRFLYDIVINYCGEKGIIVEIGSFRGCSTTWLAIAGQRHDFESLIAIDLFTGTPSWNQGFNTYEYFMARMRINKLENFVKPIIGNSKEVIKGWDKEIAILHIDGDHAYDAAKADVGNYIPYLRQDGIVIIDDYDSFHPDVEKVVHELLNEGHFQIIGLVKEIPGEGYGSIALKKIKG